MKTLANFNIVVTTVIERPKVVSQVKPERLDCLLEFGATNSCIGDGSSSFEDGLNASGGLTEAGHRRYG